MPLDELKRELQERWPNDPATNLCVRLVEAMEQLSSKELAMLTFSTINRFLHQKGVDEHVLRALAILAGSKLHVLDTHFVFVDNDEQQFEVRGSEIEEARLSGQFSHPRTGEIVDDFEAKVFPFFAASEKFLRLKAGN